MSDFQQGLNNFKHHLNKIKEKISVVVENKKNVSLTFSTIDLTFANQILTSKAKTMGGWYTFEQIEVLLPPQLKPINLQFVKRKQTKREKAAEDTKRVRLTFNLYKSRNCHSILHDKLSKIIFRRS